MPVCCVPGCNASQIMDWKISFHKLPVEKKELWLMSLKMQADQINQNSRICSRHFEESDFLESYVNRKMLKDDAVPKLICNLTEPQSARGNPAVEENFPLLSNEYASVKCETMIFKTEEDDTLDESKIDEVGVRIEQFDEPEFVICEKLDTITNEVTDEDQSNNTNKFDEVVIKNEQFDKSEAAIYEKFDTIANEVTEADQSDTNKLDEVAVKNEQFYESEALIYQNLHTVSNEVTEEDQSDPNKIDERHIQIENCDELPPLIHEVFGIDTEEQRMDQHDKYGDSATSRGEKKHFCIECGYSTNWKKSLTRHMLSHNKESAPKYSCDHCSFQTIHQNYLHKHLKTHISCGLVCILCQKSFSEKRNLDSHYIFRHPNESDKWKDIITCKINQCEKCDYKTVQISSFKKHVLAHETAAVELPSDCNICGFKCITHNIVSLHAEQPSYFCTECGKGFVRKIYLDGHIVSRHPNDEQLVNTITRKVYHCESCGYKTVKKLDFKGHVVSCKLNKAPTVEFTFKCNVCEYKCVRKHSYEKHIRTHICVCTECKKTFNNKQELDSHIVSQHSDNQQLMSSLTSKVNQCDSCGFKTVGRATLKRHVTSCKFVNRTSSIELKFQCYVCDYRCVKKQNLTTHMRLHDGQLPFICSECDKRFNRKTHLDSHIICRHPSNERLMNSLTSTVYKCENCDFKTLQKTRVINHLKCCKYTRP